VNKIKMTPSKIVSLCYGKRGIYLQLFLICFFSNAVYGSNVPTFTYSLVNAKANDIHINAITADSAGNSYITGDTFPGTFASTPGAYEPVGNSVGCVANSPVTTPCTNSFVIKLDPNGEVIFATYLGNGYTIGYGIAVDARGDIYIGGTGNLSPTPGAAYSVPSGGSGFVAKLNSAGNELLYATYIPAFVAAIAIDVEGSVYITGYAKGTSILTTSGAFQPTPKSSANSTPGFVAKLAASGAALVYATYLSGSALDNPTSIAVDSSGSALIAGWTLSHDFPVTAGAYQASSPSSGSNVFLTKLNPQGTGLVYSSNLGPGGASSGVTTLATVAVKLDAQGNAFVAGSTSSATLRTSLGIIAGGIPIGNSFLSRFSPDGSSLIYSVILRAPFYTGAALDVDGAGNAVVAGAACGISPPGAPDCAMLPVGAGAFQPSYAGSGSNVYVEKFTPDGQTAGATYLGGSGFDYPQAVAFAPNGSVVVVGSTNSPDFPGVSQPIVVPAGFTAGFVTNIFPALTLQNAANLVASSIAPGEIVALRGYAIGPTGGRSASGPVYPDQLAGVQVSVGGFNAPLFYAQSGQVNLQVPWEIVNQTSTSVRISYPGLSSTPMPILVSPSLPGIFFVNDSDGTPNSPSNPATPGDYVAIYGTGGGTANSPGVTGQNWGLTPLSDLQLPVSVSIGGSDVQILYAGSAPTLQSGVFQVNVVIPSNLDRTSSSLVLAIGNSTSLPVPIAIGSGRL
jgi:uncharacterized protein (TIGR03437 family)